MIDELYKDRMDGGWDRVGRWVARTGLTPNAITWIGLVLCSLNAAAFVIHRELWVFGLLTWVAWERAAKSFANDEVIASIVPWPAWASYALVPIGSAAMVLVCAARIVISLNNAFGRASGEAAQ